MKQLISKRQLMYSVAAFITASSMLTRSLFTYTKNETWISVILGAALSCGIIAVYGRISQLYPGSSLTDINTRVFGSVLGKLVSLLYSFFFFSLVVLNTNDLGNFVSAFILPTTPITLSYLVFLLICAYAVKKGPVSLTRYAPVFIFIYIVVVLINSFLLWNKLEWTNLLPLFNLPIQNYLLGAHFVSMLPFCEIVVFLMFMPYLEKTGETARAMTSGLIIATCIILLIVIRDIAAQGAYVLHSAMPTYSSIRLIDVGDILTRLEIIFAVMLITMLFFKVSILLFGFIKSFCDVIQSKQTQSFVLILTALCAVYAGGMFNSSAEHLQWFKTAAVYSTFFIVILPVLTLVFAEAKKPKYAVSQ